MRTLLFAKRHSRSNLVIAIRTLPLFMDLRAFPAWVEPQGDLMRITGPVAGRHQILAAQMRVLRAGGPVLRSDAPILENGCLSPVPVVANLFGTSARVAAGLGLTLDEIPDPGAFLARLRTPVPVGRATGMDAARRDGAGPHSDGLSRFRLAPRRAGGESRDRRHRQDRLRDDPQLGAGDGNVARGRQLCWGADRRFDVRVVLGIPGASGAPLALAVAARLAAIGRGLDQNLLTCSAGAQLKERRALVLLAREAPLPLAHLRNMMPVSEMGSIIRSPVSAFALRPGMVAEVVEQVAARSVDLLRLAGRRLPRERAEFADGNS